MTRKCITVDFDETLAKTDTCWSGWIHMGAGNISPIPEIIEFIKQKHLEGYDLHIVTFRSDEHRQEVVDFVEMHNLPIKDIHCTSGKDKTPKLLELNSELKSESELE